MSLPRVHQDSPRVRYRSIGVAAVLIGFLSILLPLTAYYLKTEDIVVGPVTDAQLQQAASFTLASFTFGIILVMVGLHLALSRANLHEEDFSSKLSVISGVLSDKVYGRLFVFSGLLYATFFSVVSGILVYQQSVIYSGAYPVPSESIVTCCAPIGQTPRLIIYLTDHFGILIIPLNVLLLVSISWMVGANVSLAAFAYRNRRRADGSGWQWLGSFGAATGIFAACPTCASLLFLGTLGGGEAVAAAVLSLTQPVLVAATALLLGTNLVLMARRLASNKWCSLPTESPRTAGGR